MKKIVVLALMVIFGLSVNAQDKNEIKNVQFKPTIKFNGRVQYDYEFISEYDDDTDDKEWINGNEFRRVYLSAKGKVGKKLDYKAEFEFAGGKIGYRDVYIQYNAGKYGKIALGSKAEATGLNMATSSKYITFMERSMLTSFQNFRWQSGIHYSNFGLLDGKLGLQMSLTNNGDHHQGFKDANLEEGMNFVARLTTAVVNDKENHKVVHLGVNYDKRPGKNVKFRPENHMGGKVDLGFGTSEGRSDLGFELGTTFGSLSFQGEYKMHSNELPAETYKVNTYYVFASYFLTGEHRPYKNGAFGRVKPKNDVDNGGLGALEIAARYSSVDNSDFNTSGYFDKVNNITIGLNWYLNSHARLMYNTVLSDFNGANGEKQIAHMFRVAVDF
jgi:phosphate-selective porin OprO/OprP